MENTFALVTGGSRGLGRAVCLELAALGYNIIINYTANESAALETQRLVETIGVKGVTLRFNVADRMETRSTLTKWMEENQNSKISVLVNNAGIREDGLMMWMTDEQWDGVLDITVQGFFNVTKLVLDGMIKEKFGRIINMVSFSGLTGVPGQVNYSASKAAIIGATRSLSKEVGRRNVTVNAVAPGFIKTDMTEDLNEKDFKKTIAVGRFGKPEEVASVVGFLASEKAAYITGETISVNGGI